MMFHRMGHVALNVSDLDRAEKFYTEVFGMRLVWKNAGEIAFLECGPDDLALIQVPAGQRPSGPSDLNHIGFRVRTREEVDAAAAQMRRRGLAISDGPRAHRDGSYSFYLDDPDGHSIQVLWDPLRETP